MKKGKKIIVVMVAAILIFTLFTAISASDTHTTVTILQTSDIHGMITGFDNSKGRQMPYGLARVAAVVREQRRIDPELLLIDSGDTTQGNLVESRRYETVHPVIKALNTIGYDVWTVGNHDFNFEFSTLNNNIANFSGVSLGGNIYLASQKRWISAYKIFNVRGVRVAVFGVTAPHVPYWEQNAPEHYNGMTFTQPIEEVGKILEEIEDADIIVGSIHYGLDGSYESLGVKEIAKLYSQKIDALFIGHSHKAVNTTVYGIPILQPEKWGKYVSKICFTLEKTAEGFSVLPEKTKTQLIRTSSYTPDREFLAQNE